MSHNPVHADHLSGPASHLSMPGALSEETAQFFSDAAIQHVSWPLSGVVHALYTTRRGGVSQAPWDGLNFGLHVGDEPSHVLSNRGLLRDHLASHGAGHTAFLNQVHGCEVLHLNADVQDGATADACIAYLPGLACTIMVADCLPVLLASVDGAVVAAAHAGWRGLAGDPRSGTGILEATLHAMHQQLKIGGAREIPDIVAWLGPCIGPDAFEVGQEVKTAFGQQADDCFRPSLQPDHYYANLSALARSRLTRAGVSAVYGNDGSRSWCTFGQSERFFSHRRDVSLHGTTGRMAVSIWR